jgi:HAD superfamily hydrolase (TIGR01549 family)
MINGILLDVDGTLVLSNDAHAHSWVEAFGLYNYPISFDQVRYLIGMGSDKLIPHLFPELTESEGVGKEIKEKRSSLFREKYIQTVPPAPRARDLLLALQEKGIKLVAASSAAGKELDPLLEIANVQDLLHDQTSSTEVENSKPDADIIIAALEKIDLPAHEVLLIGDTPYDIEASQKCEVNVLAVRCGGFSDESLKNAKAIYNDPADILQNIESILR